MSDTTLLTILAINLIVDMIVVMLLTWYRTKE